MENIDLRIMNAERVMQEMCKGIVSLQVSAEAFRNSLREYNNLCANIKNAQIILTESVSNDQLPEKMSDRVLEFLKDAKPEIEKFPEFKIIENDTNEKRGG